MGGMEMQSEIKPIAGLTRVRLAEKIPLATPFTAYVFPTTYCNFKCAYCGHSLGHEEMFQKYHFKPQQMSMDLFELIVSQLKQFPDKLQVVSLTGQGEPLLHPQIADMVRMIRDADVANRIEMISNASLLTPSLSDALLDAGLDCLRVSIQGVTSEKYREICGVTIEFQKIVENLRYFYSRRGKTQLFVKTMDVALDEKEDEIFYQTFGDISDRMFIECCRPVYAGVEFTDNLASMKDRYARTHEHREVCPLPFYMLGIFPDGDVEPCDTIYKPVVLGNVKEKSLRELWEGEALRQFRLLQLGKNRHCNQYCAICCAPDDVAHPEDVLDDAAQEIAERLQKNG